MGMRAQGGGREDKQCGGGAGKGEEGGPGEGEGQGKAWAHTARWWLQAKATPDCSNCCAFTMQPDCAPSCLSASPPNCQTSRIAPPQASPLRTWQPPAPAPMALMLCTRLSCT